MKAETTIARATPSFLPGIANRDAAFLGLGFAHMLLGLVAYRVNSLAAPHALATIAIALTWAFLPRFSTSQILQACAYIAGAEVFWRMTRVPIFWETGKYSILLVMLVAMIQRRTLRFPRTIFLYFLCLLPGALASYMVLDTNLASDQVRFYLSGPVLIFIAASFTAQETIDTEQFYRIVLAYIMPVIAIATITLYSILTATEIVWTSESNYTTSGGFGPNQVSTVLGFGFLLISLVLLIKAPPFKLMVILSAVGVWLLTQSTLTFSRGGVYEGFIALGIAFGWATFRGQIQVKFIVIAAFAGLLIVMILLPYFNTFTGGMLETRFRDLDTSGRTDLAYSEFQIFRENLFLGTGVGSLRAYRGEILNLNIAASHNEFTRMLGEHGLLGLLAILLIALSVFDRYIQHHRSVFAQVFILAVTTWVTLLFFYNGIRLAVGPFALGLVFATLNFDTPSETGPITSRR